MSQTRKNVWSQLWEWLETVPQNETSAAAAGPGTPKRPQRNYGRGMPRHPLLAITDAAKKATFFHSQWLAAAFVGAWDDVAGPRLQRMWVNEIHKECYMNDGGNCCLEKGMADVRPEALKEICRQILAGTLEENLTVKVTHLTHTHCVIASAVFVAPLEGRSARLAIALIAEEMYLARLTEILPVVEDRTILLALVVRALAAAPEKQNMFDIIGTELLRSVDLLERALAAWTVPSLDPEEFGRQLNAAADAFGIEFLCKAITSHLLTRGYTVIIAPDELCADTMFDILAKFVDTYDCKLSHKGKRGDKYHPDLVLQSLIGTPVETGANDKTLIQTPLPVTVIVIEPTRMEVLQHVCNTDYSRSRQFYYTNYLTHIMDANETLSPPRSPQVAYTTPNKSPLLRPADQTRTESYYGPVPVSGSSPMITEAISLCVRLPSVLRLPYIQKFYRTMVFKAITLVKMLESSQEAGNGSVNESTGVWLRQNLRIQDDADLNILFAFAEKLLPGVCLCMMAERVSLEEKFIELFEGFV